MSLFTQILIRCDGSPHVGMGHVMRCIALASALGDAGHTATFLCRPLRGNAMALIRDRGFSAYEINADDMQRDAEETVELAYRVGAKTILVDLSHADTLDHRDQFIAFLHSLTKAGLSVAVIEGMNDECISLDMPLSVAAVIVPYLGAGKLDYKLDPGGRLFAGEKYFPLRKEFHCVERPARLPLDRATRILVSIGGGNVASFSRNVIEALAKLECSNLTVKVLGNVDGIGDLTFPVEIIPYAQDMPELIAWADCAVIGSGLTRYETAYLGTPSIIFSLNAEHARMAQDFADLEAAVVGGIFSEISPALMAASIRSLLDDKALRARMAAIGPALIDGKGAARLAAAIGSIAAS